MSCKCKNVDMGSYDACIPLDPPRHMIGYMQRRMDEGLSHDGKIWVDECVSEEIKELWERGVHTRGCCCGHNIVEPMVNVSQESISLMVNMGYKTNHIDPSRKDTFRMKSV